MTENVQGICLRVVRHSDAKSIATVWTRQRGRMAVSVPAGSSVGARRIKALMQPLSTFEAVATWRHGQEIAAISGVRAIGLSPSSTGDPIKSVIALFVADFLYAVLKESGPDPLLTDFLLDEIAFMATAPAPKLANFHLSMAYRLTQMLGIAPDIAGYAPGKIFDMRESRFIASRPAHTQFAEGEGAHAVYVLSRLQHRNMHLWRMTRQQRNAVLDGILLYYSIHLTPMTGLHSLPIMREIFQ